jgi:hypothetical protein
MRLNFLPDLANRAPDVFDRIGHAVARALTLAGAVLAAAAATATALASGVLLTMPDAGLTQLVAGITAPDVPPVGPIRDVLVTLTFCGLIWAAGAWHRVQAWFAPLGDGGRS